MSTNSPRPRLSIVTVVRNDLAALKRTRESVERQVGRKHEHVIVDGASTDGTVDWLESMNADEVRWVSEHDDGIFDAMNKGVELASSELVLILNAGDVFADERVVERILECERAAAWDWSYSRARVVNDAGEAVRPQYGLRKYRLWRHAFARAAICHQTVVMRRSLFSRLGGFPREHGLVADYALLLKAGRASMPFVRTTVDIDYLDGGVSAMSVRPAWAKHKVRVSVFGLGRAASAADAAFAVAQDVLIDVRRRLKAVAMSSHAGRRLVRAWARGRR